jgi:hypothetical protein
MCWSKKLQEELEEAQQDVSNIEIEISELECSLDDAIADCDFIKEQIKVLETQIRQAQISESVQGFEKDFYTAALFCSHLDNRNRALDCVSVLPDRLQSCNGYAAIEILSNDIPDNLKNKLIKLELLNSFRKTYKTIHLTKTVKNNLPEILNDYFQVNLK